MANWWWIAWLRGPLTDVSFFLLFSVYQSWYWPSNNVLDQDHQNWFSSQQPDSEISWDDRELGSSTACAHSGHNKGFQWEGNHPFWGWTNWSDRESKSQISEICCTPKMTIVDNIICRSILDYNCPWEPHSIYGSVEACRNIPSLWQTPARYG